MQFHKDMWWKNKEEKRRDFHLATSRSTRSSLGIGCCPCQYHTVANSPGTHKGSKVLAYGKKKMEPKD
jgi:hypothetical protein